MFIAVIQPKRDKILLLCSDLNPGYAYRFWMHSMSPTKRDALDTNFFELEEDIQNRILKKTHAYHLHMQAGILWDGSRIPVRDVSRGLYWDTASCNICPAHFPKKSGEG